MKYKEYKKYIRSTEWKRKKSELLKNHPFCTRCSSKEKLQVHHMNYRNLGNEKDLDLVVLCKKCHKKVHVHKVSPFGK